MSKQQQSGLTNQAVHQVRIQRSPSVLIIHETHQWIGRQYVQSCSICLVNGELIKSSKRCSRIKVKLTAFKQSQIWKQQQRLLAPLEIVIVKLTKYKTWVAQLIYMRRHLRSSATPVHSWVKRHSQDATWPL